MKTYNSIAKTVANLEKEIKNYAQQLMESFNYDDIMVEFTGFDFDRTAMTAEITMKTTVNGLKGYNYFKVVAMTGWGGEIDVDVVESNMSSNMYFQDSVPAEHGWGATMLKF